MLPESPEPGTTQMSSKFDALRQLRRIETSEAFDGAPILRAMLPILWRKRWRAVSPQKRPWRYQWPEEIHAPSTRGKTGALPDISLN